MCLKSDYISFVKVIMTEATCCKMTIKLIKQDCATEHHNLRYPFHYLRSRESSRLTRPRIVKTIPKLLSSVQLNFVS